jgi:hypothetical protein
MDHRSDVMSGREARPLSISRSGRGLWIRTYCIRPWKVLFLCPRNSRPTAVPRALQANDQLRRLQRGHASIRTHRQKAQASNFASSSQGVTCTQYPSVAISGAEHFRAPMRKKSKAPGNAMDGATGCGRWRRQRWAIPRAVDRWVSCVPNSFRQERAYPEPDAHHAEMPALRLRSLAVVL